MNLHFIDIIEELKSTRSSWKMKLKVGVVFEYDDDDKKIGTEIFTISMNIMLVTNSNVLVDDMIKSLIKW